MRFACRCIFLAFAVICAAPPGTATAQADVTINEIRVDQTGADDDEYVELTGPASTSLLGVWLVVIGDSNSDGSGVVENATDLSTQAIPADGYFVVSDNTLSLATPDHTAALNLENADNITVLLVTAFTGTVGDDLDTDDDGALDATPWVQELDRLAILQEENPPTTSEYHYGPPTVGPDGSFAPGHVFRCPDADEAGIFRIGAFDITGGDDTPGAANDCIFDPGDACLAASDCASGHCVDGVCCDTSCGGGADDCQACSTAAGGSSDGTCGPLRADVASTVECRAATGPCDAAETCASDDTACPADEPAADGTPCPDDMTCNGTEACAAGSCEAGTPPSCDDGNECTADSCSEPDGCAHDPIDGCCNNNTDCDDGDLCTVDTCTGPGGSCSNSRMTGCCTEDADCDDGNDCTINACEVSFNRCESMPVVGCCSLDADCGDGNACTSDTCNAADGTCHNEAVQSCCVTAGDCHDDDACTADACLRGGACENRTINSCCTSDDDCGDGSACTTDTCDIATNRCVYNAGPDCCVSSVDCNDGNSCTRDRCGADGACVHTDIPGCGSPGGDAGAEDGPDSGGGGGCAAAPGRGSTPALLWLVVLGFMLRRRRIGKGR